MVKRSKRATSKRSTRRVAKKGETKKGAAKMVSNLPRQRALFAFRRLSGPLTSDVLRGGEIAARLKIEVGTTVQLFDEVTIAQSVLFKAFRQALTGAKISPLVDTAGKKVAADVSIDADANGFVKFPNKIFRFEGAGLFASDAAKRHGVLEKAMARHTLTIQEVERLHAIVACPEFADEEFLAVFAGLATSQESFLGSLMPKIKSRKVELGDLLPEEPKYWEQLIAPIATSLSLAEFMDKELLDQRQFLLAGDPSRAMRSIASSFCAPAIVPLELFRAQSADRVLSMLEEAVQFTDHFGLVGAFEICGDWLQRDPRFGPIGEKLLNNLIGNEQRLKDMCLCYGAGFVLSTARLRQHQALRRKPAFWRRLAAATHASLIARAVGASGIEPHSLFKWATGICGKAYYASVCLDSVDEPRWHPDWLSANFLIADAFGRINLVLQRLPEGVTNEEWSRCIEAASKWLGDSSVILSGYPAIGESAARRQPALNEMGELTKLYQNFIDNPSVDTILTAGPLFFTFGVPPECAAPAVKVIAELKQESMKWEIDILRAVAMAATYIAMQLKERTLADDVAEFLIETPSIFNAEGLPSIILFRLIECAAADPDASNRLKTLARRLETLAFVVEPDQLPDLYDSIRVLQKLDADLAQLLGKALAASRMGSKAA